MPGFVAAADVDHQAAVVLEDAEELAGELEKPGHVLVLVNVAVLLLEVQSKRRRRGDEVDARGWNLREQLERVTQVRGTKIGCVIRLAVQFGLVELLLQVMMDGPTHAHGERRLP